VVFGAGLLVLLASTAALSRSRREVAAVAEENRRQAMHDPLTGLPNRMLLRERSREAFRQAEAGGGPVVVMLLDLDGFKQVNDRFGHHSGDLVLQVVAQRLTSAVRPTDTVARLGGDEFAILLPVVAERAAALVVARSVQAALAQPLVIEGLRLTVGASLGLALSGEHGDDVEMLLRNADTAMYRAKDEGLGISCYDGARDTGLLSGTA
jgi:diguanylate cyclase (GGDEF)-like protein